MFGGLGWYPSLLIVAVLVVGLIFGITRVADRRSRSAVANPGRSVGTTNVMAIASLVLGVVWLAGIGSILALLFGVSARRQIRQTGEGGAGMALAGIILGSAGLAFMAFTVLSALGFFRCATCA